MIDFGIVKPGTTLYIPFASFAGSTGASATLTGLAVTDIEVYKDGGTTQRASDNGYTLLDTDGIDFDGITGIHGFSINLADNSTAGFYAAGSDYFVVVSSVTVDSQTVNFIAARFRIGYPSSMFDTTIATLSSQTSFTLTNGPAEDDAINGCQVVIHDVASAVQVGRAVVLDYTGSTKTVTLVAGTTFTVAAGDNISIMWAQPLQPATAGRTLVVDSAGLADANTVKVGPTGSGTAQTAGDIIGDTNDIQTRLPAALVSGRIDASVGAMAANVITAAAAAADFGAEIQALVTGGAYTISTDSNGRVRIVDGTAAGELDTAAGLVTLTATSIAAINVEVDTALSDIRLNQLLAADSDIDGAAPPTVGSVFHELMTKTAGSFTYDQTTDSLEAIRDRGDAAWITATGFSTHSASDVWAVATRRLTDATNISGPIADQVWEEALADHSGTVGSTAEALGAAGSAGDPWATALPGAYGAGSAGHTIGTYLTGNAFTRLGAPVGASISADIAGVQSDTNDIQTRLPAALVSGRIDASVGAMAANVITAAAAAADFGAELQALVTGGAYALNTDAGGNVRVVDGTGLNEINTSSGLVMAQLADGVSHGGTTASIALLRLNIDATDGADGVIIGASGGGRGLAVTGTTAAVFTGSANGIEVTGTTGYGIDLTGDTGGIRATSGAGTAALFSNSNTNPTFKIINASTGHGLHLESSSKLGSAYAAYVHGRSAGLFADATNGPGINSSLTGNITGNLSGSIGSVGADGITAASLATDAGTELATAVWALGTRTLTALDEDTTTLDLDATIRAAVGLAAADLDTQLAAASTKLDTIDNFLDTEIADIISRIGVPVTSLAGDIAALNDISAADVWAAGTRTLSSGTNIVLAKGVGLTGLNDLSAAQVNAEVVDGLSVDTYAEPTGVPSATVTLAEKVGRLYKVLMRGLEVTGSAKTFLDSAGADEWKKNASDDGTTYAETSAMAP